MTLKAIIHEAEEGALLAAEPEEKVTGGRVRQLGLHRSLMQLIPLTHRPPCSTAAMSGRIAFDWGTRGMVNVAPP